MQTATLAVGAPVSSLLDSCRNLASTLVVVGVGDGSVIAAINADPGLSKKDIFVVALADEQIPETTNPHMHSSRVTDWESAQEWVFNSFGAHESIIKLSGADFVETHTLSESADKLRRELWPRMTASLGDRAWSLGNDVNDTFMGLHHAALNAKAILPRPSLGDLAGSFGQTPVISVGAGPSVKEHLEELRSLQNRVYIVACDAIYPALVKEGIVADFVTPLERLRQQAQLCEAARGSRTIFAGIPACHPETVRVFEDRAIYVHAMDRLYDWMAPEEKLRCITGSSTGVLSFLVAASLTRGNVYLVGHDLAKGVDSDGKKETHFQGCDFAANAHQKETANAGGFGANGYEARMVPGNDGSLVESTMWWDTFRLEISTQAKLVPGRVFNVNAHTGKYARIEHTGASPLPDPASLPRLPELRLTETSHGRYQHWRNRAMLLPEDCRRFIGSMDALRVDLRAEWNAAPQAWKLDGLLARMTPDSGVSPGNASAFAYFLRSAFYNEQMRMCYRSRFFTNREQAFWHTMQSLDALADALIKAVKTVQPCLEEIANG